MNDINKYYAPNAEHERNRHLRHHAELMLKPNAL